jgi:hypothetical protein
MEQTGGDAAAAPCGVRAHALQLLVARLQGRQRSSTDDVGTLPSDPQPNARTPKACEVQRMPALDRRGRREVIEVGLEEAPQARVLKVGAIDPYGHVGSICRPGFRHMTRAAASARDGEWHRGGRAGGSHDLNGGGVAGRDVPDAVRTARCRNGERDRGITPAIDLEGGAVERGAPAGTAVYEEHVARSLRRAEVWTRESSPAAPRRLRSARGTRSRAVPVRVAPDW